MHIHLNFPLRIKPNWRSGESTGLRSPVIAQVHFYSHLGPGFCSFCNSVHCSERFFYSSVVFQSSRKPTFELLCTLFMQLVK